MQQTATDDTIAWSLRGDGVTAVHADGSYADGKISACCLVASAIMAAPSERHVFFQVVYIIQTTAAASTLCLDEVHFL